MERFHLHLRRKTIISILLTTLLLVAVFSIAMLMGNYKLSAVEVFDILFRNGGTPGDRHILFNVRIPRLLCCCMVGAALSVSGLAMQSLFKNPMASPSILGISAGASFGASLAISFGIGFSVFGFFNVPLMAFSFCFATMGLVYVIARTKYGVATVTLLLAGVAVGAFFNGLVSLIQYIADEDTLAAIVYWTMGSFNKCNWTSFYMAIVPVIAGTVALFAMMRELNLISAGEEQAANMGVNVKFVRAVVIVATSLCVGGSVAISGTIGFVGLIVPHIFRMIVGPNHNLLVPLCVIGGAAFMITMDTMAKAAFSVSLPVGVLTSLLGAPFFVYILRTRRRDIWE